MNLSKKQKRNLKIGGGAILAITAIAVIANKMNSKPKVATTVNPGNNIPVRNVVPGAPLSAVPVNAGVFASGNMPTSPTPSGTSAGGPTGGGIIGSLASNPFINPLAIVPKVFGLFGR